MEGHHRQSKRKEEINNLKIESLNSVDKMLHVENGTCLQFSGDAIELITQSLFNSAMLFCNLLPLT